MRITKNIHWEVAGLEGLGTDRWYLVIANHQSWSDILVLQKIFNRKIPFLKFFLKKELIWVPFMGIAWWRARLPVHEAVFGGVPETVSPQEGKGH
jgi:1-acyl-sn-glycerol-3-phosphate acyltransferase